MDSFEYEANPGRAIFGRGTLKKLPGELKRLGVEAPLVLSTPQQVDAAQGVKDVLDGRIAGIFSDATMHTPVAVTERALGEAQKNGADCLVSIGGGSTIGLGKAISIRTGLPHICIPTTYAGSEVTPLLGETSNGEKTSRKDPKILPATVIYDVDLTMSLPVGMSMVSGVNAMAHAVVALYANQNNPITNMMAIEGVRALASSLPDIAKDGQNGSARELALYGAWLCGVCLGSQGMSLHHKPCHVLGGCFNLPHAETHTAVLPHALSYNAPNTKEAMETLAAVIPNSQGDPVRGLNDLLSQLGVQRALKDFGMKEEDIDKATDIALKSPYWNPRPIERRLLRELIRRAWSGEPARANL